MSVLRLEHVSYRYKNGDRAAVNDVTCSFEPGRLTAVVGPSGSGKSTLLSLVAGLDQPTEGMVCLDGEDVGTLDVDRYRRERVSMIFQAFHLFPLLTTLENVCYPMELNGMPQGEAKQRARELLISVGIQEDQHRRYPAHLSGGEQQRVAIARALSTGAKVLLADEPTGNLDSRTSQDVLGLMKVTGQKFAQTMVMITHNEEIAQLADRIVRIEDGRIVTR